jgi:signal transduction histidine kinase
VFSSTEALSQVSHELRNPLNSILAFGQLLALDELSESQRHSVEQILAGGHHLLALLEDLLDLSHLAGALEAARRPVNVAEEIAQAVALCRPLAGERSLTLSGEPREEPLWALADPRRLKQVLLNLVSNAVKFNRAGGSVALRAAAEPDGRVRIDVADTGPGLTAEQISRLFAPFERLDAGRRGIEGNGLGLAVSKALAEAMGGSLEVASIPGAGSVFSLRLAAAQADRPAVEVRPQADRVLVPAA